jgi:hypothetical protein
VVEHRASDGCGALGAFEGPNEEAFKWFTKWPWEVAREDPFNPDTYMVDAFGRRPKGVRGCWYLPAVNPLIKGAWENLPRTAPVWEKRLEAEVVSMNLCRMGAMVHTQIIETMNVATIGIPWQDTPQGGGIVLRTYGERFHESLHVLLDILDFVSCTWLAMKGTLEDMTSLNPANALATLFRFTKDVNDLCFHFNLTMTKLNWVKVWLRNRPLKEARMLVSMHQTIFRWQRHIELPKETGLRIEEVYDWGVFSFQWNPQGLWHDRVPYLKSRDYDADQIFSSDDENPQDMDPYPHPMDGIAGNGNAAAAQSTGNTTSYQRRIRRPSFPDNSRTKPAPTTGKTRRRPDRKLEAIAEGSSSAPRFEQDGSQTRPSKRSRRGSRLAGQGKQRTLRKSRRGIADEGNDSDDTTGSTGVSAEKS